MTFRSKNVTSLNKNKKKINVFFNEYNLFMGSGGVSYLPFVSGILSANAKKIPKINNNFQFHKFIFHPDTAENIIKNYDNNYWEFTRKKVIWARKSDKIKNEIDFDNKAIEKLKKIEKGKINKMKSVEPKNKVDMFDQLNKFMKYDSLEVKR